MWFVTWNEKDDDRIIMKVVAFEKRFDARDFCEEINQDIYSFNVKLWEGFENYA